MTKPFKPMLAVICRDPGVLKYPLYASPKLDGIRCIIHPELGPVSRSLKPIQNHFVRKTLSHPALVGLDGELIVGDWAAPDAFVKSTSGIMSHDGEPNFTFWVFDNLLEPEKPFRYRNMIDTALTDHRFPWVQDLCQTLVNTPVELAAIEAEFLAMGFEGTMLRDPMGIYKFGRSTLREGILIKRKPFEDLEAEILDVVELMHNGNEATTNALGYTERSSKAEGKVGRGMLGAFVCRAPCFSKTFEVGTGMTEDFRKQVWEAPAEFIGRWAKLKYQAHGSTSEKPRIPVFLGIRDEADM